MKLVLSGAEGSNPYELMPPYLIHYYLKYLAHDGIL